VGDFQGHPFRGNQWTEGSTFAASGDVRTPESGPPESGPSQEFLDRMARTPTENQLHVEKLLTDATEANGLARGGGNMSAAEKARIAELHTTALGHAQSLGVTFTSELRNYTSASPDDKEIRVAVEAAMLSRTAAAIAALPEDVQRHIKEQGITFSITSGEPAKFSTNGVEFTRGGFARGFSSGYQEKLAVSLHAFTDANGVPQAPGVEIVGHEFGHIAIDASGNLDRERIVEARQDLGKGVRAIEEADAVQEVRLESKDLAGTYNHGARALEDLAKEADLAGKPGTAVHLRAQAATYRSEAEDAMAKVRGLSSVEDALRAKEKVQDAWRDQHAKALADLTAAVNEEGGVTGYAQHWHLGADGKDGKTVDPVHRGVHESVAEIEGAYLKRAIHRETPEEFAKKLAEGKVHSSDFRHREGKGPAYPKIAKAWVAWRKTLSTGKSKMPRYRLGKAEKDALATHRTQNYSGVRMHHERAKGEIAREIDSAKQELGGK
jgi:hypothetical protein